MRGYLISILSVIALVGFGAGAGVAWADETDAGYCPRLEGKRSGVCHTERSGSNCIPGQPCSASPIFLCEEESTFDQPFRSGGTCIAYEERCTVVGEVRTCEQVCTKWDPGTCEVTKSPCCRKYKMLGSVKQACCGGKCVPVGDSGQCGDPAPPNPGKKLPLCGADGGC